MPKYPQTVSLDGFKGLNNKLQPEKTPKDYLKEVVNFDIDQAGSLSKRKGYSQVYSGTDVHSVFSNNHHTYFVDAGTLKYLLNDFSTSNITTGCHNRVDYTLVNGLLYFTSRTKTGILDGETYRSFGLEIPTSTGILTETTAGQLSPGRYQFVYSYVDDEGRESGTSQSSYIDIAGDNAAIQVSNINPSTNTNVLYNRLYLSTVNGMELFWLEDTLAATESINISSTRNLTTPLDTFNIRPAPSGDLIAYYNGRIYIADGPTIYASEPYSYEWFRLHRDFVQMDSDVKMLMPVQDGIYVGTETGVYYLSGSDITAFKSSRKEACKPVMYSNIEIPGGYIRLENIPIGPKWLFTSDEGIHVAMNQGVIFNLTAEHVGFPQGDIGAATFIQRDGINRYISLIKDQNTNDQNSSFSDLVTADIIRNGVQIT